jgi:glycosyltransferase involved in cell wall biosynthesis
MTPARRILVVVLAYNEAATVGEVVRRAKAAVPEAAVLVVDDGSSDATAQAASEAGAMVARLPVNLGIGGAAQTGQMYALRHGYDVMVRVDGDGQHPPEQIPRLIGELDRAQADLVVGSRFLEDTGYRPPLARSLGIRFFAWLLTLLCGQRLTDTTSGFMAANRRALAHLARLAVFDYPEVESLLSLHRAGLRLAEAPVRMAPRVAGRSSIRPLHSAYYAVKVLLAILVGLVAAREETPQLSVSGLSDMSDPSDQGKSP